MESIFEGLSLDLGINLPDIFGGIGIFISQFWPIIAFAIALTVAFKIGGRLISLGRK